MNVKKRRAYISGKSQTIRSGVEHTNHEATVPPLLAWSIPEKKLAWLITKEPRS